jgi:hypothetical protein
VTAYGKRLKLRLFLEGVEIPVIAANVQSAPNGPMVASIQVPPLAEGTRLFPRTTVHLFFLDTYSADNPLVQVTGDNSPARNPSVYEKSRQNRDAAAQELQNSGDDVSNAKANELNETIANSLVDLDNEQYKVLFMGEIIGFQWTKSQNSRALVLQCEDFSNYWDYAYQFNNTDIFGPGLKAIFSGGATNLFTDFLTTKGNVVTQIVLSGHCNSFPKLKGMAAGLVRLIEAIGGSYYPSADAGRTLKKFAGQNIFFSLAELRLHLSHMMLALDNDPTSSRILSFQGYSGLLDRILGGLGEQTSIRACITALSGIIFHSMFGQPCPYYVSGVDGTVTGKTSTKFTDTFQGQLVGNDVSNVQKAIADIKSDLNSTVSQPELATLTRGARGYAAATAKRILDAKNTLYRTMTIMRQAPETARSAMTQAARALASAAAALGNWTPKSPKTTTDKINQNLDLAVTQLGRVLDTTVTTTTEKQKDPARLGLHIFRPDIWFGAPPRCNVIFPEDYDSLQYQRLFLQEPTRFLLKTNDEFFGEDFLFDKFYFAPQTGSVSADRARLQNVLRNDLLDHELFTGILPVFEKMGEFNVFASRSGTQRKPTKVGPAQRSANFLYFKHRFAARQMQLTGKFNPYVAVGFPGLVIDRYIDRETVLLYNQLTQWLNTQPSRSQDQQLTPPELSEVLGTNFLGSFAQVTHSISNQAGAGRTDIVCAYARQPEESVEFLGAQSSTTIRKNVGDVLRATDVACFNPPKLFSIGPLGGVIENVTDVTNIYMRGAVNDAGVTPSSSGQLLPLFERPLNPRTGNKAAVLVPIGVTVTPADLGSTALADVLGSDFQGAFRAYRVEERVPRFRRETAEVPAEELIRPGWYGDVWTNSKIGRAYQSFLGIGSITDKTQITDPNAVSTGSISQDQADAAGQSSLANSADDPRVDAPRALMLDENASIQQAVEFLVLTYSYIKQQNNMNVDEFIRSYTWRPIASMVDMFGTSDLEFRQPTGESVVRGIEGFHSRAFGPYDNVFGLVGADLEDIVGIKRGSVAAQRADTRKRKLEAVQKFISALNTSRAILG